MPVALVIGMRPRQWLKNVLVFAAPLAAGSILEPDVLRPSVIAFIAFCLMSSATYLINDIRDVDADRAHPTKRNRPIAAGDLSPAVAATAALVLAAAALGLDGVVGNLQVGCEADFVVLNPHCTPLVERRTAAAGSLDELLFALIVLGDDRLVERVVIAGMP